LHWDVAAVCAADPYQHVTSATCGTIRYVSEGFVDTGYTYYYDSTSGALLGIAANSADFGGRTTCLAGHIYPALRDCMPTRQRDVRLRRRL
jgi:hypothetical protein